MTTVLDIFVKSRSNGYTTNPVRGNTGNSDRSWT